MASGDIIIGIDLGTTNSVVAYLEGHEPVIVPNAEGRGKTPSTVAFLENGDVLTGEVARRQAATQPQRTISSAKRLIGRFKSELDEEAEIYPFEIGEDEKGRAIVLVDGVAYSPQQISALILQKLKLSAEEYLERPVSKAIITVPAYFDDVQRHATLEAAELAGLEVLRLINEPTAAAMAYGLGKKCQETVAIYDFGGGTFDFSILEIDENIFEVLTSTGNSRLGGDDVDMALVDHVADEFLEKHRIDLRDDLLTFRRLKDEMERVKCELSTATTSIISLPFIAYSNGSPVHLERTLNRETLEEIIEPFIAETLECCDRALRDSGVKKKDITKVILVGGSTRTPLVQEMVEDFFGIAPFRGVNPDEVVSIGAAMQGAVMAGDLEEVVLLDVTPHSLSIEVKGDRRSMLIEKNSTIPIKIARHFTTAEDNQSFVNVHLLQGEEDKASDNRSLGKFTLSGLPEAKAGQPRIRVEIFVNADGVVELSAFEEQSGKQEKLTTSFNYLDADERRKRQGLRSGRGRKNRRLRNGALTETQRRRILESSPVVGSTVSSAPVAEAEEKPYSPSGTRRPVAPTPEEALSESRVRGRGGTGAGTRRRPKPMGTKPSPSLSGTGTGPILERGPVMAEASAAAEAWENSERSGAAAASARVSPTDTDTDQRTRRDPSDSEPGSTQRVARPETMADKSATPPIVKNSPSNTDSKVSTGAGLSDSWPMQPSEAFDLHIEVPAALSDLVDRLNEGMADEAAELYQKLEADFLGFCEAHTADVAVQALKAKCLIVSRQPEEARAIIAGIGEACPEHKRDVLALYGLLCRQYPNYVAARWDRALLATQLGEHRLAMNDLEFVAKRETSGTDVYDDLQHVYEKALQESWDATIQFKLVKMHLRRGDLDDAITLLQQLVQIPGYRERADKVLGLCFWQKGLRYLALQKFKSQPMTDEIKDILYRLSADMEENDELLHAKYALERIYESDISFRDVAERLRRIAYRVDLMKDKRYGAVEPSGESEGGEENPSLLGDRFELVCEINRGSMGIVYKAHDRSLDEIVALKVLNDFLVSDPEAVRRFKQEARSARRLAHPNIVRIHDFLDLDHKKLISMEFIEGEDLKTILARNATLSSEMVIFYLRQICDAMAYAHALGIVHRDIKPANIMIDDRNSVKVTDFGIAKVIGKASTNNGTMVMGTPLYMSPEQIQGGRIDPRADIYALGIMLYELVTGSPPFYEGNIDYQHCHKPVPPITIGIDERIKNLIYRCVEKKPDDRFQSITELLEAVSAIET